MTEVDFNLPITLRLQLWRGWIIKHGAKGEYEMKTKIILLCVYKMPLLICPILE